MFELKIALKYLLPKKRALSSSLISLMSVTVISLVVWLVLVFLSVTSGIEKNWLQKLTAMHAPIRLSPTDAYYNSYFYQIDSVASASNYTCKTIGEKFEAPAADPYLVETDPELPSYFAQKDTSRDGQLRDLAKSAYDALGAVQEPLIFQDYEISGALMRLNLKTSGTLSQMAYLLSIPEKSPSMQSLMLSPADEYFVDGRLELPDLGEYTPAILPKNYQDSGIELGNSGTFSFAAYSAASMQEQKILFKVVGFYDPGVMAVGNKCILVPKELTRDIYATTRTFSPDGTPTNGIFVWTDDLSKVGQIEEKISTELAARGLSSYWKVTTYENFEFSKGLLDQFRSDKTLLLIVGAIILIVACSNIISLLVLLVNDKKKEIAILQTMGASFKSIALIFGSCGMIMGLLSCVIGSSLAIITLHHIDKIASFLSLIQGRAAFNPAFFGKSLPSSLSFEAFLFILVVTPILSLIAGLIPAIKASRIRPSTTLKAE